MALKDTITKYAPLVATALSGGTAGLAALAVNTVADALGSDKNEAAVAATVAKLAPDELASKLAGLDTQFAIKRLELELTYGVDLARVDAADRASARQREAATGDHVTPRALAAAIVLGFFGVIGLMIFQELPETGRDSLLVLVGALGAAFGGIVQYYFGSSTGSHNKQRQLDALRGK